MAVMAEEASCSAPVGMEEQRVSGASEEAVEGGGGGGLDPRNRGTGKRLGIGCRRISG